MLFVELGREVFMRELKHRQNAGVVTGIIDNKFVVIIKQDETHEIVRVDDIVLGEKVYNVQNLKTEGFFKCENKVETSDFDRYKLNLKDKVTQKLIEEMNN